MLVLLLVGYLVILSVGLLWFRLPPLTILVLSAGTVMVVAMALQPLLALHGFLLLLFVEHAFGSRQGITGVKMIGALIVVAWLMSMAARRGTRIRFDRFSIGLGLFIAWCGVALIYALDDRAAVSRTLTFVQLAFACLMFSSVVDTPSKLRGVLWAFVIWSTLSTLYSLLQAVGGREVIVRGLVGDRNLFAVILNVAIVGAYFLMQSSRPGPSRLLLGLILPVLLLGLALTLSRGGLVVLTIAMIAIWYRAARERRVLALIGSVVLLSCFTYLLPERFWQRARSIVPVMQQQVDTFGMRVKLWTIGYRMVVDRPVVGVGPGNFITASPRYARGAMLQFQLGPHNSYVGIAAENGVVGLVLFCLIHVMILRSVANTIRAAKAHGLEEIRMLGMTVEICLIVLMVGGLSISLYYSKYLWLFLGLGVALAQMGERLGDPRARIGAKTAGAAA
jgi:O-antigen ligase